MTPQGGPLQDPLQLEDKNFPLFDVYSVLIIVCTAIIIVIPAHSLMTQYQTLFGIGLDDGFCTQLEYCLTSQCTKNGAAMVCRKKFLSSFICYLKASLTWNR